MAQTRVVILFVKQQLQQTVMEIQLLIGHVVLLPINVTREKATVIGTQTVLEVLPAEPIIVEQCLVVIGGAIGVGWQIAAKVVQVSAQRVKEDRAQDGVLFMTGVVTHLLMEEPVEPTVLAAISDDYGR